MDTTVIVRITKNYGQEAIYPANKTAEVFAQLVGKKTLDRMDISKIKTLGYQVQVETPEL